MVGIGAFRVFRRTRLNIEPYSPLKPTKVGFIFIGPNSISWAEDLAAVIHVNKLSLKLDRRFGLKVGFQELRLAFLNRRLRTQDPLFVYPFPWPMHIERGRRRKLNFCDFSCPTLWPLRSSSFDFTHNYEKSKYIRWGFVKLKTCLFFSKYALQKTEKNLP